MKRWTRFGDLPRRCLRTYTRNLALRPDFSENRLPNGTLIYQTGGAFPVLRFRRARMSNVCCGIMAAYNALALSGIAVDYLELAAEFERNAATPAIPAGIFGCLPWRTGACLAAHGAKFTKYRTLARLEDALTVGKVGVLSYKFSVLDPRMHTFTVQRTEDGVVAYNHFSTYREVEVRGTIGEILSEKNIIVAGFIIDKV